MTVDCGDRMRKQRTGETALVAKVPPLALLSVAPGTVRQRRTAFRRFASWCAIHGRNTVPASPGTVVLFLADMAERYRPSTINSMLTTIALAHRAAAQPFDRRLYSPIIEGIRRTHGAVPRLVAPITVGELRTIVGALPDNLRGVRDRALLTVGFAGALRCSEIVGLDIGASTASSLGSVVIDAEGLRIVLNRSKGDQLGKGLTKWLPRGGNPCPVQALERWLARANITSGAVFRGVQVGGYLSQKRLHENAASFIVKRSVYRSALHVGLSEEQARAHAAQVSSHSLRVGFVTSAVLAGVPSEDIASHVGWSRTDLVFHYTRQLDPFKNNPAQLVLSL